MRRGRGKKKLAEQHKWGHTNFDLIFFNRNTEKRSCYLQLRHFCSDYSYIYFSFVFKFLIIYDDKYTLLKLTASGRQGCKNWQLQYQVILYSVAAVCVACGVGRQWWKEGEGEGKTEECEEQGRGERRGWDGGGRYRVKER